MKEVGWVANQLSLFEDRFGEKTLIRSGKFEGEPEKDSMGIWRLPPKKVGGLIVPSKKEISY